MNRKQPITALSYDRRRLPHRIFISRSSCGFLICALKAYCFCGGYVLCYWDAKNRVVICKSPYL